MGALECRGKLPNALRTKGVDKEEEEEEVKKYHNLPPLHMVRSRSQCLIPADIVMAV
jgi:hypothetical protein